MLDDSTGDNGIEASGLSAGSSISLSNKDKLSDPDADDAKAEDILETTLYQVSYKLCPIKYWQEPNNSSSTAVFSKLLSGIIFTINAYRIHSIDKSYCILATEPMAVNKQLTIAHKKSIVTAAKANIKHAINVLLAGKVGLFTTNHHIGQGKVNLIMSKILKSIDDNLANPTD